MVNKFNKTFPLVSIVTPVYNSEQYLEETIKSIRAQTYNNIEYIVIDGGSTDKSLEIIINNKDVINLWISEPDRGMYDAIDKGFRNATGDIYCYVNSDDLLLPNAVEAVVEIYRKKSTDLIVGITEFVSENGQFLYDMNPVLISKKQCLEIGRVPFTQSSSFWSKKAYKIVQGFGTKYKYASDLYFFLKIMMQPQLSVCQVQSKISKRRLHNDALSSIHNAVLQDERKEILLELKLNNTSLLKSIRIYYYELLFKLKNYQMYRDRFFYEWLKLRKLIP